jgi:hypothetical protein
MQFDGFDLLMIIQYAHRLFPYWQIEKFLAERAFFRRTDIAWFGTVRLWFGS